MTASFSSLKEPTNRIVKQTLDSVLGNVSYSPKEVQNWVDTVSQAILDKMQDLSDGFKYVVTATILQRSNAGFHLSTTCYWDYNHDGSVTFRWENKSMHAIVTVLGIAI
ncbi:unnamed protein product [Vitrella brassicaformis CCMP3155]|uniref:Dynein light chain Tctex-type 1 n=1 Tax=Vitrella brassicaformis (strain CCMP3155) TaxID=1169540 RepID=A0A0G4EPY2_VITBC|nr:unnamed protein product [Vitrella brassicaformis CCMP3155]|eukprot:CEL99345.1 unnamed protein product [Vitrella brassicaformis CCMP3155]